MFDGKAFGEQIVKQVRGYVARATDPLAARLTALEARVIELEEAATQPRGGR